MIGKTLSNFHITAKLGEGGMGEVYLAEDTRLGREVAIKVLPPAVAADPDRLARFQREARVLASLNHPNIASIHDVQEVDGQQLLILELVGGVTLAERIARGPVPLEEALGIARQIAEALENAHENGVIHRDLKPANVKITPEGAVKVLDFGLAKAMEQELDGDSGAGLAHSPTLTANMTVAGMLMGTAAYMSPEQARGLPADKRGDVWAFGCVLFEMLTGRQAFQENTVSDTLAAVLKTDIALDDLPAETPERVRRLVRRCLEKDHRQRLRDIGEARIATERALADPDDPAPVTSSSIGVGVEPLSRRSNVLPWALVALVAVVAAAFGIAALNREAPLRRVVRSALPLPPETVFALESQHPGPPALSPDGTRIVFAAHGGAGADSTQRLWIRDLDVLDARPLAGTEEAAYPFWSPDGTLIGFFADGKLKKVKADGGAVLSLCDASRGKGGAWSSSGDIVFAPDFRGALYRVSDAGGEPVQLTTIDEASSGISHRHPRMLPDARHFLYVRRSLNNSFENELYLGSLDGDVDRALIRSSYQGEYALGHLLFLQEAVLMARPFDVDTLSFSGDAFPVAEEVGFVDSASVAVFSAAGDSLVYLRGDIGSTTMQLNWKSRTGQVLESIGEPLPAGELQLSPDQTMAAVLIVSESNQNLWVWDLERQLKTRLTFSDGAEYAFAWAPDNERIAYASFRGGTQHLYVTSLGGGDETLLLDGDANHFVTDWSADGRYIIFMSMEPNSPGGTLSALDLETSTTIPIEPGGSSPPGYGSLSSDGKWLAYSQMESGQSEIFITAFPEVGRRWRVSTAGGGHARWNGDGSEIFYVEPDSEILMAATFTSEGQRPVIGRPQALFQSVAPIMGVKYAPAADGQRFLTLDPVAPKALAPLTLVWNWSADLDGR